MLYQYPLEALARRRACASQLEFALDARRLLVDSDDAMFEAHEHGLAIFTAHEDALAGPARVLRERYGDFVEVRRPKVRLIPGNPAQEPIMEVRVSVHRDLATRVHAELRRRYARVLERCARGSVEVFRAEAPLRSLLGLPSRLRELTGDTGTHAIRLVRYVPVTSPGRPAA